jgi:hypothetical protein
MNTSNLISFDNIFAYKYEADGLCGVLYLVCGLGTRASELRATQLDEESTTRTRVFRVEKCDGSNSSGLYKEVFDLSLSHVCRCSIAYYLFIFSSIGQSTINMLFPESWPPKRTIPPFHHCSPQPPDSPKSSHFHQLPGLPKSHPSSQLYLGQSSVCN